MAEYLRRRGKENQPVGCAGRLRGLILLCAGAGRDFIRKPKQFRGALHVRCLVRTNIHPFTLRQDMVSIRRRH
jgi:hypothetical protein